MAEPRPSSQASQRDSQRSPLLDNTKSHPPTALFPARKTETDGTVQDKSNPEALPQTRHDSRWIQVSASTAPHTVRTGPDTGITTTGHTTPRNSRDLDRAFQCVRSTGAKGGGSLRSGAKRLTRASFLTTTATVKIALSLQSSYGDGMRVNRQGHDKFPQVPHTHTHTCSIINKQQQQQYPST